VSADEAAQVAAAHQATQKAVTASQIAAAVEAFRTLDPDHPIASWIAGIGQRIFVLTSTAQELMATQASDYAHRVLGAQGLDVDVPAINARNFAGIASDGRSLDGLLAGAAIRTSARLNHGDSKALAMRSGEAWLRMAMQTQIADAARAADSIPIAVGKATVTVTASDLPPQPPPLGSPPRRTSPRSAPKEVSLGYVRMLDPPSCDRCAVLAGKWYRWNAGFQRHPLCDCRSIPAPEATSDDLTTNPQAYFNSLSKKDQDEYFGVANAQAIRDGADMGRVVNAQRKGAVYVADNGHHYTRAGTSRRGRARARNAAPVLRPTVWQIYRDSNGDRDVARLALKQFGYVL
jgi:hypothetical protein